ncbi:MAG: caspase family protein [Erythrobacter sp.]
MLRTVVAMACLAGFAAPAAADTATIYATQSGLPAYDADPYGGNPFASALIAALGRSEGETVDTLFAETIANSGGLQFPDLAQAGESLRVSPAPGEAASAMVIVFADYGDEKGLVSLPGAAFDAIRVGRALANAGYEVRTLVAADAATYRDAVSRFARDADEADRALLYTTGHGVEVEGKLWLIPPEAEDEADMLAASIPMAEVGRLFDGPGERLLLYAGCRDNPMQLGAPAARTRVP